VQRIWRYVNQGIWETDLRACSRLGRAGIQTLRVIHMAVGGFHGDECLLHASALTFNTLMSIVPVLALSLALARGLGDEETARTRIRATISEWTHSFAGYAPTAGPPPGPSTSMDPHREITTAPPSAEPGLSGTALAEQIDRMVDECFEKVGRVSFKALGGVGLVLLLWMVIGVLGGVEASFNRVWGVQVGRSIWRRFTDYLSVLFVLPLLAMAASSLPIADFASRYLDDAAAQNVRNILGSGVLKSAAVLVMTTASFMFVIAFMPNTRVQLAPALAGGGVAGLLFILWLRLCAALQVGVARYSAIYGSFAVVPILLAWVYVSWQIVLFGAEVAFAVQNCATYRMEHPGRTASPESRIRLALAVVVEAARAMFGQTTTFDTVRFARENRVPVRFLNEAVGELERAGLVAPLSEGSGRYVLLKAPESVKVGDVVSVVMREGATPGDLGLDALQPGVIRASHQAGAGIERALGDMSIRELIG
jgi:membrane protein